MTWWRGHVWRRSKARSPEATVGQRQLPTSLRRPGPSVSEDLSIEKEAVTINCTGRYVNKAPRVVTKT